MCLNSSWFDEAPRRARWRDKHGVTLAHAREALEKRHSTVYPIASEMAGWLYRHWTLQQLRQLTVQERDYVVHLAEESGNWPGVREARRKRREARKARQRYTSPIASTLGKKQAPKPPRKPEAPAEWLAAAAEREQQRAESGVSLHDAARELASHGTAEAYRAAEMAAWIDRHWTLAQWLQLPPAAREVMLPQKPPATEAPADARKNPP